MKNPSIISFLTMLVACQCGISTVLGSDSDDSIDIEYSKNFIKGGKWPAMLLNRTVPEYKNGKNEQRINNCEECLMEKEDRMISTPAINYIAGAKAGSRTLRYAMSGCYSDPDKTFAEQCPGAYAGRSPLHHCHRCSISKLEEHGAQKLLIPVREPRDRLKSLIKYQWKDCYRKEFIDLLGEEYISPNHVFELYDSDQHQYFLRHVSFAWQSYDYYFAGASGNTDLHIICIGSGHPFVPQYNYAMKHMNAPANQIYNRIDNGEQGNAYKGKNKPNRQRRARARKRMLKEKEVYPEIKLEHELWQTYCATDDDEIDE